MLLYINMRINGATPTALLRDPHVAVADAAAGGLTLQRRIVGRLLLLLPLLLPLQLEGGLLLLEGKALGRLRLGGRRP